MTIPSKEENKPCEKWQRKSYRNKY